MLVQRVAETTGVDIPEIDDDQVRTLDGPADHLVGHTDAG
jgi:hypothetical protein